MYIYIYIYISSGVTSAVQKFHDCCKHDCFFSDFLKNMWIFDKHINKSPAPLSHNPRDPLVVRRRRRRRPWSVRRRRPWSVAVVVVRVRPSSSSVVVVVRRPSSSSLNLPVTLLSRNTLMYLLYNGGDLYICIYIFIFLYGFIVFIWIYCIYSMIYLYT